MSYGTDTYVDHATFDSGRLVRGLLRQTAPGSAALAVGAIVGVWMLYGKPPGPSFRTDLPHLTADAGTAIGATVSALDKIETRTTPIRSVTPGAVIALRPYGVHTAVAAASPVPPGPVNPYGALLDPGFAGGIPPAVLAQSAPLGPSLRQPAPRLTVASATPESVPAAVSVPVPSVPDSTPSVPVPAPRPPELRAALMPPVAEPVPPQPPAREQASRRQLSRPHVAQQAQPAGPQPPSDGRNFLEKLFGLSSRPSGPQLAYAAPEDGGLTRVPGSVSRPVAGYDRGTAVYDIAAHTVYMPNGARLEAHSGLGNRLDDPRFVNEKNRGPTPPAVYELQPREQLFHGVQALRLNPVGGEVYGRNGLLAHTFMLGARGDSNGCVSFRNYNAFLQAYVNGEVKRLVVVARLN